MSDLDDMLPVFLEEARENLELLGLSLLALEQAPGNSGAVNDAFRAAHSLKGMAAAMGYSKLTQVTHALEQLLDGARSGSMDVNAAAITSMLEAVDACTALVANIENEGAESFDIGNLVELLLESHGEGDDPPAALPTDRFVPDAATCTRFDGQGMPVLRLTGRVAATSLMPSVRAFAALTHLEMLGTVLGSNPSLDAMEHGELADHGRFEAWIATDREPDEVAATLLSSVEIDDATCTRHAPDGASPTPTGLRLGDALASSLHRGSTVRIDAERLDHLMHSVGELLVRRSHVESLADARDDHELRDAVDALGRAAQEMQTLVMDVRMIAVDSVFRRLPRLVRDLSLQLEKDVNLQISGGDTELDRTVIDLIGEPLVHLVRNAIDHGIESPAERVDRGKAPQGTLAISAVAEGGSVVIRVRDDGSGMRPDAIRSAAVRKGVIASADAAAMSDEDALQLCFEPGFSTRTTVTEISGRGVGLDAVRASVRSIGGDVVANSSDEGTIMTIRLPLTLAIVQALLVRVGSDVYGVQSSRILATLARGEELEHSVAGRRTIVFRDQISQLVTLHQLLDAGIDVPSIHTGTHVVVVETGSGPLGFIVDDVVDQVEIVTRPLPPAVRASPLISASAVLGNGEVAFVLDTEALGTSATHRGHQHARTA